MNFHPSVPQLIMRAITDMIFNVDPVYRIRKCTNEFLRGVISGTSQVGIWLPTIQWWYSSAKRRPLDICYTIYHISQIVNYGMWNAIASCFDIDNIAPIHGTFNMNRSCDFWDNMSIHHKSNLQLLPNVLKSTKKIISDCCIGAKVWFGWKVYKMGESVSHIKKQIHDAVKCVKTECHSLFNWWVTWVQKAFLSKKQTRK